jgi:hypothetical protein
MLLLPLMKTSPDGSVEIVHQCTASIPFDLMNINMNLEYISPYFKALQRSHFSPSNPIPQAKSSCP